MTEGSELWYYLPAVFHFINNVSSPKDIESPEGGGQEQARGKRGMYKFRLVGNWRWIDSHDHRYIPIKFFWGGHLCIGLLLKKTASSFSGGSYKTAVRTSIESREK